MWSRGWLLSFMTDDICFNNLSIFFHFQTEDVQQKTGSDGGGLGVPGVHQALPPCQDHDALPGPRLGGQPHHRSI